VIVNACFSLIVFFGSRKIERRVSLIVNFTEITGAETTHRGEENIRIKRDTRFYINSKFSCLFLRV